MAWSLSALTPLFAFGKLQLVEGEEAFDDGGQGAPGCVTLRRVEPDELQLVWQACSAVGARDQEVVEQAGGVGQFPPNQGDVLYAVGIKGCEGL
jgi:hypothetical protein